MTIYLYIRHTVEDYARWKEGFDIHAAARQAAGATGEISLLRDVDDPDDITIILGWRSLKQARAFTQSVSLREAMQKAGVSELSEIRFLAASDGESVRDSA